MSSGSKESILKSLEMKVEGKLGRGGPKRTWSETIIWGMKENEVTRHRRRKNGEGGPEKPTPERPG